MQRQPDGTTTELARASSEVFDVDTDRRDLALIESSVDSLIEFVLHRMPHRRFVVHKNGDILVRNGSYASNA